LIERFVTTFFGIPSISLTHVRETDYCPRASALGFGQNKSLYLWPEATLW
jgi:hypothetical protein